MAVGTDTSAGVAGDLHVHLQRVSEDATGSGRGDAELRALSALRDVAVAVVQRDGALTLEVESSGARLTLAPWNGGVFTAKLVPVGRFVALAEDSGPIPQGLVDFQIDKEAKLNVLRLLFDDGQAYDFKRE